jgi:hypothetical protein
LIRDTRSSAKAHPLQKWANWKMETRVPRRACFPPSSANRLRVFRGRQSSLPPLQPAPLSVGQKRGSMTTRHAGAGTQWRKAILARKQIGKAQGQERPFVLAPMTRVVSERGVHLPWHSPCYARSQRCRLAFPLCTSVRKRKFCRLRRLLQGYSSLPEKL